MGGSTRRTVLILGESVALAHVGRPVVLARALDPDRYDVHVAFDPRHEWVARDASAARYHPLASITPEAFLSTPPGRSYTLDELRAYLADERRLYEEVQPDLVVADFRPTAPTSGAAAGIPVATLVNAHWSPHRRLGFPASPPGDPAWRATLASSVPVRALRKAVRAARPRGSGAGRQEPGSEADLLARLRAEHGLPPVRGHLQLMVEADHVLHPEPPGFVALDGAQPHHRFVGPVVWSPQMPPPDWWDDLPDDRPVVYVTMGSTGDARRLPALVRGLAGLDASVVVSTAGRFELAPDTPGVFTAAVVPGDAVCARAAVVVGSGGSGTAYQALAAGTPVVGLWSNPDQYLTSTIVEHHGAGISLPPEAGVERIVGAVGDVLARPDHAARAAEIAALFATHDPAVAFRAFVDETLGAGPAPARPAPA